MENVNTEENTEAEKDAPLEVDEGVEEEKTE